MKSIITLILALMSHTASAIDYNATNESVWIKWFGEKPSFEITDTALRTAMEWKIFGGPVPKVNNATHYGLLLTRWERSFKQFGFALVADDYAKFLRELKAELSKNN